jgi:hypothetical protein
MYSMNQIDTSEVQGTPLRKVPRKSSVSQVRQRLLQNRQNAGKISTQLDLG